MYFIFSFSGFYFLIDLRYFDLDAFDDFTDFLFLRGFVFEMRFMVSTFDKAVAVISRRFRYDSLFSPSPYYNSVGELVLGVWEWDELPF